MRALVAAVVVLWAAAASASPAPSLDAAPLAPARGTAWPWPLSELPSVQPHLDLAMAHDACTPAAQQRQKDDEIRAYLAAWCRIRAGEREAVDALAPIATSKNLPLARIAQLDVVNLLADYEPRQQAVKHLGRLRLSSAHTLDLLAATYLALGQHDDAYVIGTEAIGCDEHPSAADRCERELAWSSLEQITARANEILGDEATNPCQRRVRALSCAVTKSFGRTSLGTRLIAMRECYAAFQDDPDVEAKLAVIASYSTSQRLRAVKDWLDLEHQLEPALSVRGGEELAVSALEAVWSSTCVRPVLDDVAAAAKRLRAADRHDSAFDPRLAALAKPGQQCRN